VYPTIGATPPSETSGLQYGIRLENQVRRLTPLECERLQGFPETENTAIMMWCSDHPNSLALAVSPNPKRQKPALLADELDPSIELAKYVAQYSPANKELAVVHVRTNYGQSEVVSLKAVKSNLFAPGATEAKWLVQPTQTGVSVLPNAVMQRTLAQIIAGGKVASQANEQPLTEAINGEKSESKSGIGITQPANGVSTALTIPAHHTMFTTSSLSGMWSTDSNLLTSFFSVLSATIGFTPASTPKNCLLALQVTNSDGWTALRSDGLEQSDSQRYKQMGNAVAVPVVEWVIQGIVELER
jgi:DNA (cytosine-5)-methyltransferase 1